MPARLSLVDLVRDGGFRPTRHADRLAEEPLSVSPPTGCDPAVWQELRALQRDYTMAGRPRERAAVASDFAAKLEELNHVIGQRVSFAAELWIRIGSVPRRPAHLDSLEWATVRVAWRRWLDRHADAYCDGRACPPPPSIDEPSTEPALVRAAGRLLEEERDRRERGVGIIVKLDGSRFEYDPATGERRRIRGARRGARG